MTILEKMAAEAKAAQKRQRQIWSAGARHGIDYYDSGFSSDNEVSTVRVQRGAFRGEPEGRIVHQSLTSLGEITFAYM